MIFYTDKECVIGVRRYPSIPLLVDETGEIWRSASDYLRFRIVHEGRSAKGVMEEAVVLQLWHRYLKHKRVGWEVPSDALLQEWRDCLAEDVFVPWIRETEYGGGGLSRKRRKTSLRRRGWKKSTVNRYISVVYDFYLRAQTEGWNRCVVRPKDADPGRLYPISSAVSKSGRLKSTLLYATPGQPNRHTPTEEEILKLHSEATCAKHANRNKLVMSWFEEAGLRRSGALASLKVNQIPSYAEIEQHLESDQDFVIQLQEKGRRPRQVVVMPMLMESTRDYISEERKEVVARYKRRSGWKEPYHVFLSDRGTPLTLKAFSNIMTYLFRRAGVPNCSGHRLRARFAVRLLESLLGQTDSYGKTIDHETILLKVAEALGHVSTRSLRPYLKFALMKAVVLSDAEQNRKKEQVDRQSERRSEQWGRRVAQSEAATALLRAIRERDKGGFSKALAVLIKEVEWRHVGASTSKSMA